MTQECATDPPSAGGAAPECPKEVDVAIFGAGPAGLSTALALSKARPDLKVHVFERASKLRPSGGSIALFSPNLFAALDELGVTEAVKEAGIQRRTFIRADMDGSNRTEAHVPSMMIAWFELQRALMTCLPRDDMVTLGCELAEIIEEGEGAVVAKMSDGRAVRAKVVIGADGNRSACRRFIQGDTEPEYVGAAVWRFFLPGENPFVEVSDSIVLTGDCKTLVMQPVKREGEVLTYVSGISGFDEARLHELNQTRYVQAAEEDAQVHTAKLARFKEALEGFHPEMMAYVVERAVPESVLEHPMYSLDPRRAWVRGRVALVGDSAHVMPPNLGQGTPMAVEDAVQLASSLLQHGGPCPAALADYEHVRKERVTPIWEESTRQAEDYYKRKDSSANPMAPATADKSKVGNMFDFVKNWHAPCLSAASEQAAAGAS